MGRGDTPPGGGVGGIYGGMGGCLDKKPPVNRWGVRGYI